MDVVHHLLAEFDVPSAQVFTEVFEPAKKKAVEPETSSKPVSSFKGSYARGRGFKLTLF